MSWNNRIIRKTQRNPIKGSKRKTLNYYDLHEVYYRKNGKPYMWTEEPIIGGFDSVKDLRSSLAQMLRDSLIAPVVEIRKKKGKEMLVERGTP